MRKNVLLLFLLLSFGISWAQKGDQIEINRDFNEQMQVIFGKLEKDRIPNGILAEYAFPFADIQSYNGTITDSTDVDLDVFSNIYKTLMMGRIHAKTESDFLTMEAITKRWAKYRKDHNSQIQEQATVVLSGLLYSYASLPEESFALKKIQREGNVLKDSYVNGIWQNPYEVNKTVAISPPLSEFNSQDLKVILPKDLFLSNSKGAQVKILADFSDGNGFRPFPLDSIVPVKYNKDGRYDWIFQIDPNDGGKPLFVKSPILINKGESTQATEVLVSNGLHSAVLRIVHAPGHDKRIKKPLIVAEGFDTGSILSPERVGGDRSIDKFLNTVNESYDLYNLLKGSNQEYDIIYIDWNNGVGDIRENAKTLEKVIDWVNQQKRLNNSTEPNVLLGQSMGGLVSRYALVKMEQQNKKHDVRLFIAHDSPFQGANTPVSAQILSRHVLKVYLSNPAATAIMEMVVPFVQNIGQMFDSEFMQSYVTPYESLTIQDSPAALQMTKYFVKNNFEITNSMQNAFQQEMNILGYPIQSRNVAISNGNLCGLDNGYEGGSSLLFFDESFRSKDLLKQFLYRVGANIWGMTSGNIKLGIITLIPGRAKISCLLDLRAIPEQNAGDRTVYSGRVNYTVLVFDFWGWRPSVSTPIVPLKKVYIHNNFYPLETFAGGTNSIKNAADNIDIINLPAEIFKNPEYSFIPVTSGLDIKRNNGTLLSVEDNRKAYESKQNLENSAFNSPFANFITEIKSNDIVNFEHISFSSRNGSWLAKELNREVNQIEDCSFICNTDKNGIVGSGLICQSENYYSEFTARSYKWQVIQGSDLVKLTNENTKNVNVSLLKNDSNGLVILQLKLAAPSCGEIIFLKEIWVRKPKIKVEVHKRGGQLEASVEPWSSNDGSLQLQQAQVIWQSSPPIAPGTNEADFSAFLFRATASGFGTRWGVQVKVTVKNACGSVTKNFGMYGGGFMHSDDEGANVIIGMRATNNINEYEVVASVQTGDKEFSEIPLLAKDQVGIYVHNLTGQLLKTTKESTISIDDLPMGTYILNAIVNDQYRSELKVYKK